MRKRGNELEVLIGSKRISGEVDTEEKLGIRDTDNNVVGDQSEEKRRTFDHFVVVVHHMIHIFGWIFVLFFRKSFANVLENRLNHHKSSRVSPKSSPKRS